MNLNDICQIVYPAFWLGGFFLVSNYQKRIGFFIGLVSIPLALYSFFHAGLWGSFVVESIAGVILARGAMRAYKTEPDRWR